MTELTFLRSGLVISRRILTSLFGLSPTTKALSMLALAALLLGTAAAHTAARRKAHTTSSVYTVTATAYEAVAGQTDSKPFITADNSRIPRGYGSHTRWLALSRDLLKPWGGPFEFGDKVRVAGISPTLDGVYTVHDTMNRRYRHRLDVLAHPRERISINQPGVRLQRALAYNWASRQRAHPASKARAKVTATHHQASAKYLAIKPLAARAHQRHRVAKKQLAAQPKSPKKQVGAQVRHPEPLRIGRRRPGLLTHTATSRSSFT